MHGIKALEWYATYLLWRFSFSVSSLADNMSAFYHSRKQTAAARHDSGKAMKADETFVGDITTFKKNYLKKIY